MKEVMGVKEASKRLGVTPFQMRMGIAKGIYPFGVCYENKSGRKTYKIFAMRMEKWIRGEL